MSCCLRMLESSWMRFERGGPAHCWQSNAKRTSDATAMTPPGVSWGLKVLTGTGPGNPNTTISSVSNPRKDSHLIKIAFATAAAAAPRRY